MKKFKFTLFVAAVVITLLIPLSVSAETEGSYTYTVSGGKATITDFSTAVSGKVVIPDTLGGYTVTGIDRSAFEGCYQITEVVIPDSVAYIGYRAFYGCSKLQEITLPFVGESKKESSYYRRFAYIFGTGDKNDHHNVPQSLKKVTITNEESLPRQAFYSCWYIESVVLSGNITEIEMNAFENCQYLTSVIIPDSVVCIAPDSFKNSGYYNDASNWEDGVLYIGNHLIDAKSTISSSYTVKEGTKHIAASAFNSTNITEVIIPDSVTHIGASAFSGNSALKSVILGKGVENIGASAFSSCSKITAAAYRGSEADWENVTVGTGNTYLTDKLSYDSIWLILYDNDGEEIKKVLTTKRTRLDESIVPEKNEHTYKLYADQYFGEEFDSNTIFMEDSAVYVKYTINQYTYTFLNYDGSVFYEKKADYGSVITPPSDEPFRTGTKQYTYLFVDWEDYNQGMTLTEDISFEPNFEAVTNRYTYTFLDAYGKEVKKVSADYGSVITPPAAPVKNSTAQYDYTFSAWTGFTDGMRLTGNVTFTPEYTSSLRNYTYEFLDAEGFEAESTTAPYGSVIVLPEENPEKAKTAQYTYEFAGWEGYSEGMRLTGNITFTPEYTSMVNKYTYIFTDYLGLPVKEVTANYGTEIKAPLINPERPKTAQYTYIFTGWDGFEGGMRLTGDISFAPEYRADVNYYTYTFLDGDGEVFFEEEADYGSIIQMPDETPRKTPTVEYHYIFTEWENYQEGMTLKKDISFAAIFEEEINYYTYTFLDGDGEVFFEDEAPYGSVIPMPEGEPEKTATQEFTFSFSKWKDYTEGMYITKDVTFEAEFDEKVNYYTYTFFDAEGEVFFSEEAPYGTVIQLPEENPEMEEPYYFDYWEGYTRDMRLTEDVEFTPIFALPEYEITVKGYEEYNITVMYGDSFSIEIPEKERYAFMGYFSEENGAGELVADESGECVEEYLYTQNITVYPYFVLDSENKLHLIGEGIATIGEEATLSLVFSASEEISGITVSITYPAVLSLKGAKAADFASVAETGRTEEDGMVTVSFEAVYGENGEKAPAETMLTPFEIIFETTEGIEDGYKAIFEISDCMMQAEDINFEASYGAEIYFSERDYIPGDVNGDGEVTRNDLLRLAKHFSGFAVEIDEAAADVTGDGEVTRNDLLRLAKYFSGFDVELGQ